MREYEHEAVSLGFNLVTFLEEGDKDTIAP